MGQIEARRLDSAVPDEILFGGCPCETDNVPGVTVFDLLIYLNAWFQEDPAADLNGDNVVDVFDLLDFLGCWFPASTTGC